MPFDLAQSTNALIKKHVIDLLHRATGDDEFLDSVMYVAEENGLDTSAANVDELVNDPEVQAAFRKACESVIGTFQYAEESQ